MKVTQTVRDQKPLLHDLTNIVILPTYRSFDVRAGELAASVEALCKSPDEAGLEQAQQAWRAARLPYTQSEAFQIGPVVDLRIDSAVDFWPIRLDDVDEVLTGSETIDDAYIDSLGATRKGLPVLERLLFDAQLDSAAIVAELVDGDGASRRCRYAEALARDVAQRAQELASAWEPSEGNFAAELVEAGHGSNTFGDQAEALTEVVSRLLEHTQRTENQRLGTPLGRKSGVANPGAVESPYAQNALADLQGSIDGIESVYLARYGDADGVGLSDAVSELSPALDTTIQSAIGKLRTSVAAIPPPLAKAVVEQPAAVDAAFQDAKQLLRLFSADMAGALGTTPTFSDLDGD